jgi:hypothetical protein
MSLIFDNFKSRERAEEFAADVRLTFRRRTDVHDTQEEMVGAAGHNPFKKAKDGKLHDYFPYKLNPPIVLVERLDNEPPGTESRIIDLVVKYGGEFAGT